MLIAAFCACGPIGAKADEASKVKPSPAAHQDRKLNIRTVIAEVKPVRLPIVGTGSVFALKTSRIGPLVEGPVLHVFVSVGDRVEEGAPLFEIRPDSYRFAYEEAKARLAMVEARLIEAEPAVERAKKLIKRRTISQTRLDQAVSALTRIRAEIASTKVAIAWAKKNLEDTVVEAPYRGVITGRFIDEGVYLSPRVPGGNNAVIELKKIDVVRAIVQMPARELGKLSVGAPVELVIDGMAKPVRAKVSVINDSVDVATRTLEVRIEIENPDYAIKPGLFVRARILPPRREAIVIPREALRGSMPDRHVFVLSNGKAEQRPVRAIDYDAVSVEILSGLEAGEHVLIGPDVSRLTDGLALGGLTDVAG